MSRITRRTKREDAIYLEGREVGYKDGFARGIETGQTNALNERKARDRAAKADAIVNALNAASQAVSAMAALLDNAHGVLS